MATKMIANIKEILNNEADFHTGAKRNGGEFGTDTPTFKIKKQTVIPKYYIDVKITEIVHI